MSERRLLDYDPYSGLYTYHARQDGQTIISHAQDGRAVHAVLEANKRQQRKVAEHGGGGDFRLKARIPAHIQYKWLKDHGVWLYNKNHRKKVERLLKDPEYRYLLAAPTTRQDFVALRNRSA